MGAMNTDFTASPASANEVMARLLRDVGELVLAASRELESVDATIRSTPVRQEATLDDLELGSLQRAIVGIPGIESADGIKPGQMAKHLVGHAEPNIRQTLRVLNGKGVVEMVPASNPQRWRLAARFRPLEPA